ncbi:MAG: glycerol-3-phosphate 1-O-acyltransferase PlsY [Gemmatimonadota bacterium]|nr:glycerol-3-phosphate 1-O-acyltransferase PlsY [Gemmatimonadota bacterium]
MPVIVGVLISYLVGSIPSAYLAGRARGVDLRAHGSGNLGATNVARVLGNRTGILVFVADVLKGFLPVWILPRYIETANIELWAVLFGAAAIIGHVKPVFLAGKGGGKGVATASGVFLALAFVPLLIAQAVWAAVFLATRYVSLASLVSAVILPIAILTWWRDPMSPVFIASLVVAGMVFWTHRANIGRLRRGEEHRFVKEANQP